MVPVRKPGRPLSVCPHPPQQSCGCGSVTAAIPRKQACHCGSASHTQSPASNLVPGLAKSTGSPVGEAAQMPPEAPSPTKVAFKVQKSSRPSSRKQSFDPANLERMNMNQFNMLPYEQRSQNIPGSMPNGYIIAGPPQAYGFTSQYANIQPQYGHMPLEIHADPNGMNGNGIHTHSINGYTNGLNGNSGLEHVIESPLATPTTHASRDSGKFINGGSYVSPETPANVIDGEIQTLTNGGSCCAPKQTNHSHNSSTSSISVSERPIKGSCCSSKSDPEFKQKSSSEGGSAHVTPPIPPEMLPQNGINGISFNAALYPQYGPQHTVFTYPATYGSFQNPLQPSAWRESLRSNNYSQALPSGPQPFNAPVIPETLDTVHRCTCGDGCQCIGCLAHPYNDATQEYVESAWALMKVERQTSDQYDNHQPPSKGTISTQPPLVDHVTSPTAQTPSSSTSGNDEEQNLSAADFFFVNYPFMSDGCGGDKQSCPCGDDCQCLGCTIHRQPAIPCSGEKESCRCGADCQCIGCSIHSNGHVA